MKTDTKATLKLKGITGVVFIELTGGAAEAKTLIAATPAVQVPEIPAEKSTLATLLDELPKVVAKFSALEDRAGKVVSDVGGLTTKLKENPSLLSKRPKENTGGKIPCHGEMMSGGFCGVPRRSNHNDFIDGPQALHSRRPAALLTCPSSWARRRPRERPTRYFARGP